MHKKISNKFQPGSVQPTNKVFPQGVLEQENSYNEVVESFDDMNLKEPLLKGIYTYGFDKPSAVQSRAILPCLTGKDVIVQAQSGTGKTATFSISVLQNIDDQCKKTQAVVLSPTRELTQQSADVMKDLGKYTNVSVHVSVGGAIMRDEMEVLKKANPHVIVGTHFRVLDLVKKGGIKTKNIRYEIKYLNNEIKYLNKLFIETQLVV